MTGRVYFKSLFMTAAKNHSTDFMRNQSGPSRPIKALSDVRLVNLYLTVSLSRNTTPSVASASLCRSLAKNPHTLGRSPELARSRSLAAPSLPQPFLALQTRNCRRSWQQRRLQACSCDLRHGLPQELPAKLHQPRTPLH